MPALAACGFASGSSVGSGEAAAASSGGGPAASTGGGPAVSAEGPAGSVPRRSLDGKVIVIDPGHNGGNAAHASEVNRLVNVITERKACDTTGTETRSGYAEHAFTWDVSNRTAKILKSQGAKVVLTRGNDTGVGPCVTERAAIGNKNKADAALSVHADGAPKGDRGFHIIEPGLVKGHNDKIISDSRKLGLALRDAYHTGTGMPFSNYRGTKALDVRDDLGGLNLSTRPKVFIECGNMQDPGDAAKLSDPEFRQKIAEALADGLTDYLT
ncbi:N-acetylmuramoyl-L-alanine amidase [Actinomadura sp. HBU206391]|uniref:N-acetylmuramoyl-L-alanine amidase n=1 Tax=Actinomadura sp. HBU206391 TaxID=2731692 RepID=UPI0016503524|nr:N-acetylmuramoyl-L-alanine amidase [Actinomadura sp. HBU206391]MBC6457445.1 N-acetylmuramoyl-L-alanine amidase [Actinomadura sp. HBU206391]